jgi:cytochrome c
MLERSKVVAVLILGLMLGHAGLAGADGDPESGERLFRKCKQCHTLVPERTKVGPSLAGVVGRAPGSVEGFGYSQDLIDFGAAGNDWNAETLDAFLTKPRGLIRQTKMAFPGLRKKSDREDLIAYLSQF